MWDEDKKHTTFEANQCLYQLRRVSSGLTDGMAAFQRAMDNIISEESLEDTFAYLDDITICSEDQTKHSRNRERFLAAASKKNVTYNEDVQEVHVTYKSALPLKGQPKNLYLLQNRSSKLS